MSRTGLKIDNLTFTHGANLVLNEFSLHLPAGSCGYLLGHSGAGKSTLLRLIAGLEHAQSGCITLDERVLNSASTHLPTESRRIGLVTQYDSLFPHLDVSGNIAFSLQHLGKAEQQQHIEHWLQLVALPDFSHAYPHELSGGEKQRISLARTLASKPQLVLLDEPYAGLDTRLRQRLSAQVYRLLADLRTTALVVTHDWNEALAHADYMGVLHRGQLLQWDTPQQVCTRPQHPEIALFSNQAVLVEGHVQGQRVSTSIGALRSAEPLTEGKPTRALVRRQDVVMGQGDIQTEVVECNYDGSTYGYRLRLADNQELLAASDKQHPLGTSVKVMITDRDYLCYE